MRRGIYAGQAGAQVPDGRNTVLWPTRISLSMSLAANWAVSGQSPAATLRRLAREIRELKERHKQGATHPELAAAYGLSTDAVDLLCHGTRSHQWRWLHSPPGDFR